jgi:hypothetical protein
MSMADTLPKLDDKALTNLHANVKRLSDKPDDPRNGAALKLLPEIDAEIESRAAAKPRPVRATRKAPARKKA